MKLKHYRRSPNVVLCVKTLGILAFLTAIFWLTACRAERQNAPVELSIYPEPNSVIWGYQEIQVSYIADHVVPIKSISYDIGDGTPQYIDLGSLRYGSNSFRFTLCAECLASSTVTLSVEFSDEARLAPLIETLRINHLPKVRIDVRPSEGSQVTAIDASSSTDPEGHALSFEWQQNGIVSQGPTFAERVEKGNAAPVLLKVSDGTTVFYNLVSFEPRPQPDGSVQFFPVYTDEKLKCTDLEVVDSGRSLLHPALTLGPLIKKGDTIELDAGNKAKKNYLLMYRFEVRATVEADKSAILYEGQDLAASTSQPGAATNGPAKGRKRKSHKPKDYEEKDTDAAYPENPSAASPPTMIQDSYEFHPAYGRVPLISPNGDIVSYPFDPTTPFRGTEPNKDYRADSNGKLKLAWFDSPGFAIKKGMDLSHGAFFRGYFYAWLEPDLTKCKKYFTIVLELDEHGLVKTSELTRLN